MVIREPMGGDFNSGFADIPPSKSGVEGLAGMATGSKVTPRENRGAGS